MKKYLLLILTFPFLLSCSNQRKIANLKAQIGELKANGLDPKTVSELNDCNSFNQSLKEQLNAKNNQINDYSRLITELENEIGYLKKSGNNLLDRLTDMSVINKEGAESIRKSLNVMQGQNKYISDLNQSIKRKDSLNMSLVMNLKRSLSDVNDEDVTIEIKKGVVYVSLSDKLMFKSGSAEINKKAEGVLSKVSKILKDHKELEILVEGHTDNVPINNDCIIDNWDLSAKRATSVVRLLSTKYKISPDRLTAAGRSQFIPKASNSTLKGRQLNRRTEIIIIPKFDQFFKLYTEKQ